jgi:porin
MSAMLPLRSLLPLVLVVSSALQAQDKPQAAADAASEPKESEGLLPVPQYMRDLFERPALTGDWGGVRQDWADHGFTIDMTLTTVAQRVVSGGVDVDSAWGGSVDAVFKFDLMRMGILPGAIVTMRVESRQGQSVNSDTGQVLPANLDAFIPLTERPDEAIPIAITELNYTQFLSESLALLAGKVQTLDGDANEFASGRGRSQFMNLSLVENPVGLITVPYSTLAAGAIWLPSARVKVSSLVMDHADSSTTSGLNGGGAGKVWVTEADFQYAVDALPGGMNLGGMYAFDGDYNEIGGLLTFTPGIGVGPSSRSHSWAAFWSGWQYLRTESPPPAVIDTSDGRPDVEGLGLFARFGVADEDTNPFNWSGSLGVGARGLVRDRHDDTCGLGYFRSDLQQPATITVSALGDHSEGVEAYYEYMLTHAASLTLDTQWLTSPFNGTDDDYLVGLRLNVML